MINIMDKEYDSWNIRKKKINNKSKKNFLYFKEREIWWCYLGLNVGVEQDGKGDKFLRPVLVVKKFSRYLSVCIPLTTSVKQRWYFHTFDSNDGVFRQLIVSQIRVIDTARLHEKITSVSVDSFLQIKTMIRNLF